MRRSAICRIVQRQTPAHPERAQASSAIRCICACAAAFSTSFCTECFEWTPRNWLFDSNIDSATLRASLSAVARSSPHDVEASHSGLPSASHLSLRLLMLLCPPALLATSLYASSAASASSSPPAACSNSRTRDSLNESCSFCNFLARSLTTCRQCLNSKSSMYRSKSKSSAKLMRSAACSSSKSSFSPAVIAHIGLDLDFAD
mmetsp:Transcript_44321/g.128151  ORF Transcript_44321/g.128151 Transcript_44321/m.128151 type:complete len:203 (-) Transcript_44321:535-1143(-)